MKILDDNGEKIKYFNNNEYIKFYPIDVLRAINKINPNKAVSWDYIPGIFINKIKNKLNSHSFI